ncbi:MAG: hypothetical protein LBU76_07750 [Azoarcus sp.]|jgi:hypothetical protein|nr:hypothetical protein [Azoarcus sp.]
MAESFVRFTWDFGKNFTTSLGGRIPIDQGSASVQANWDNVFGRFKGAALSIEKNGLGVSVNTDQMDRLGFGGSYKSDKFELSVNKNQKGDIGFSGSNDNGELGLYVSKNSKGDINLSMSSTTKDNGTGKIDLNFPASGDPVVSGSINGQTATIPRDKVDYSPPPAWEGAGVSIDKSPSKVGLPLDDSVNFSDYLNSGSLGDRINDSFGEAAIGGLGFSGQGKAGISVVPDNLPVAPAPAPQNTDAGLSASKGYTQEGIDSIEKLLNSGWSFQNPEGQAAFDEAKASYSSLPSGSPASSTDLDGGNIDFGALPNSPPSIPPSVDFGNSLPDFPIVDSVPYFNIPSLDDSLPFDVDFGPSSMGSSFGLYV